MEYVDDYVCAMFPPYFNAYKLQVIIKSQLFLYKNCTKTMQITKNPYLWDYFLDKLKKALLFFTFYLGTCFQVSEFPTYFQAKIASYKKIVNVCKNCIKSFQITKNVALLDCLILIMLKRKTFFVYFLPLLNIYSVAWF